MQLRLWPGSWVRKRPESHVLRARARLPSFHNFSMLLLYGLLHSPINSRALSKDARGGPASPRSMCRTCCAKCAWPLLEEPTWPCPWCATSSPRQGKGAGPGSHQLAAARPGAGVHRQQGVGGDHGRRRGRHQPQRPASCRHSDGGSARPGKTTTTAKLAKHLIKAQEKVLTVSGRRVSPRSHRTAQRP